MKNPKERTANRLIREKSPYLLQHAYNPVDWYPWGNEAFQRAVGEDKPIFLSIGYSTCHWCHVMERETFENREIAELLNRDFISIKVDREERPDVDQVYMAAVQVMTQSGGWPLTVFLTPDLKPFMGGTYFPPEDAHGRVGMKNLLPRISDVWRTRRDEVLRSSEKLVTILQPSTTSLSPLPDFEILARSAFETYCARFDSSYGGFGSAPKFPATHNLSFLLWYTKRFKDSSALEMVEKTLQKMAGGGIFDHVGGGFHRYSTDERWLAPHFEKMLYDQAILSRTYLEAFQVTGHDEYAEIARSIFSYIERDLLHSEGGIYSAEDADSEGEEGKFYVWTLEQIQKSLEPDDAALAIDFFDVTPSGNFEHGTSILNLKKDMRAFAEEKRIPLSALHERLKIIREKLREVRKNRIPPLRDEKILCAWNGLMISSLASGSTILAEPRYLKIAVQAAEFVLKYLQKDGELIRRYCTGESAFNACHDDYAYFILGLMDLYEATFEIHWLKEARRLALLMMELFEDTQNGGFFYAARNSQKLIAPTKDYYEGAIPSSNSVSAWVLFRLAKLFADQRFESSAVRLVQSAASMLSEHPTGFPWLLMSLDFYTTGAEVLYLGETGGDNEQGHLLSVLQSAYYPGKVLLGIRNHPALLEHQAILPWLSLISEKDFSAGEKVLICRNQSCQMPISSDRKLSEFLNQ